MDAKGSPRSSVLARAALAAFAVASVLSSGCAAMFVSGPPADHERRRTIDCSSSNAAPVVDTVIAGSLGLAALASMGDGGGAPLLLLPTAVFAASAGVGFGNTSACRDAQEALERRVELEDRVRIRLDPITQSLERRPSGSPDVTPWEDPPLGWEAPIPKPVPSQTPESDEP